MSWYNLPNASDTQDFLMLFKYLNTESTGWFFGSILFVVWVITFIASFSVSSGVDSSKVAKGFTFASFITSMLAVIASVSGLLAMKYMYLPMLLTGIGALWLKLEKSRE